MSGGDSGLRIELPLGEVGSDCCLRLREVEVEVEFKAELRRERISLSISDVANGTGPVDVVVAVGFGGETGLPLVVELQNDRGENNNY